MAKRRIDEAATPEPERVDPPPGDAPPSLKKVKQTREFEERFAAFTDASKKAWPNSIALASEAPYLRVPRVSSGNLGLDIASFGGWPRGRFSRVVGMEKSCKTGTCLNTVAQWQQHCGACYERFECDPECAFSGAEAERPKAAALWIDAEHRLESMWYWPEGHGVDLSRLLVQSPPDGQHIVDFTDACIREKGASIGLIVIDSLAHVTSAEEIEKPTIRGRTGPVNAALMNRAFRKWTAAIAGIGINDKLKPTLLLINQIRHSMDQYHPEVFVGGLGQNYATGLDVRLTAGKLHYLIKGEKGVEDKCVKFGGQWKPDEDAVPDYVEINYRILASGTCPPGRYGQFNYWLRAAHGRRIGDPDNVDRMWDYVKTLGLMAKEGRTYSLFGVEADTQAALKAKFYADVDVQTKVWAVIVEKLILAE